MDGNLALAPAPIALPIDAFKYTDLANAERLADAAKGQFVFVPDLGWFKWEKSVYVPDNAKSIERLAGESALSFGAIDGTKAGMDWARKSLSRAAITNAVLLAQTVPDIVVMPHELDSNPLELCTPTGIINLETGILRDADPLRDFNTMQTAISPKHQETPMWDDFLNMVITEKERIDYIQELLGVALVGEVRWHILPVFVGVGANGKSTLLEIASKILGNYSRTMPENFLLDTSSQQHSTEIANLRGVRFAVASETRPDGKFNESRIKMLTGGDTISARKLYKDFFDFQPSHTLFLALNHLPSVRSGGAGFWRRLRKIDFKYQVPAEKQRQGLADDIVNQEGPGILAWMIEGAMRVIAQGITEPTSVQVSTNEYRGEEDHISRFIEEMIVESPMFTTSSEALLRGYRTWCNENGETPLATTPFIRELRMRVSMNPVRRTGGARAYSGIGFYNQDLGGGGYYGD
jgi:putative DNA primase/helicase